MALRSLSNKRAFSFLNIAGLAVGMAASLLLFLVIGNETSYDKYHDKEDRVYSIFDRRSCGILLNEQMAVGVSLKK
jgi:putative ABC transport system permease protein